MNLYPALKAKMGDWDYYVVKMKMKDLAKEVNLASEVHNDPTLDDAIQRAINESRAKGSIVDFLAKRKDRFFASIVVAALGGNATFYPVSISDDPQFKIFSDQGMDQAFGVLTFDGSQAYYALDGQHRLKAIKIILGMDPDEDASMRCPKGFRDEEISVIVVLKRKGDTEVDFRQRYRRLFSSLNRYAKPTDADTNIIMDEDDVFAIITRKLITDYAFFSAPGRQKDSFKVQTKGKNLQANGSHFTSLQTLYKVNTVLLTSAERENEGWGNEKQKDINAFIGFRPEDEYIDELYKETTLYWDALQDVLPELKNDPPTMRVHEEGSKDGKDSVLFWPIGQELMARLARRLLNGAELGKKPAKASIKVALQPLAKVDWDLHNAPWRFLLLTRLPDGTWKMRSEDRNLATTVAEKLLIWILGVIDHTKPEIAELKKEWRGFLIPQPTPKEIDEMWDSIEKMRRSRISK